MCTPDRAAVQRALTAAAAAVTVGAMRAPVATAAVAYAAFTALALALHGFDPLWFVWIGTRFADGLAGGSSGYDGQFVYFIARDGWAAAPHLDAPAYRFSRILAPLLARALSGGEPRLIPWAMLAVNYAALLAGTAALTAWLRRGEISAWWALAWSACGGLFLAYSRDLTEPLAYGLAAVGVVAWFGGRSVPALAALALAALARETTLLIVVALAAAEAIAVVAAPRRWPRLVGLALSALPWVVWNATVAARFGSSAMGSAPPLQWLPLAGALPLADLEPGRVSALLLVGLPALLLLPGALAWVWRAPRQPLAWMIALHCLLILALAPETYLHVMAAGRLAVGLVLALVLAFPSLSPGMRGAVTAVAVAPTLLWLGPVLWWAPWAAQR